MKRVVICLMFLCFSASIALAGGWEGVGIGSRAILTGGAFIGKADDWTAIYWNPAGLAQLSGSDIGIHGQYTTFTQKDSNSVKNFDLANYDAAQGDCFFRVYPTEPASFTKQEVSASTLNPSLGGYRRLGDYVVGAGMYVPVGSYVKWEDSVTGPAYGTLNASYYALLGIVAYNLSLAKEINSALSIGGGINLLSAISKYKAEKSLDAAVFPPGYTTKTELNGSGTGYEGVIGMLYKLTPNLKIGAVYRSGATVDIKGDGSYAFTLGTPESSSYTQKFPVPATYGIGLAFEPNPKMLISFDLTRTNWSSMKTDIDFATVGAALRDSNVSSDWQDSNRVKAGMEFKPNETWTILAGVGYDQNAAPDKAISLTNLIDLTTIGVELGVGYKRDGLKVNAGYVAALPASKTISAVEYSSAASLILLDIGYSF